MRIRVLLSGALISAAFGYGCSSSSGGPFGPPAPDASPESDATTPNDAASGTDATPDVAVPPVDEGGPDATVLADATDDTPEDDAAIEAGPESFPDAAVDSGATDAQADGGGDAGASLDAAVDAPDAAASSVGGRLAGLTLGESIVIQDTAGDALTLDANGPFTFPTAVANGTKYTVSIKTSPATPIAQVCAVVNPTGTMGGGPVANVDVNCDLFAYFPFTGNADDASGYGNDATITNATLTNDHGGGANGAYAFDGHGYIDAPNPTGFLPSGNVARSLTAWIEPTYDQSEWGIVYYGTGNCTAKMFGIGRQNAGTTFWSGCDDFESTVPFPVNTWSFIAMVYNGAGSLTVYNNGMSTTTSLSSLATPTSGDLIIGADLSNGVTFTGNIDSIRLYGHALTSAEVQSIYSSAAP